MTFSHIISRAAFCWGPKSAMTARPGRTEESGYWVSNCLSFSLALSQKTASSREKDSNVPSKK